LYNPKGFANSAECMEQMGEMERMRFWMW